VHMHNIHLNYFSKFVLPKLTAQKRTIWTLHDSLDLFEDYPDKESDTGEIDFYKQLSQKQRRNLRRSSERIVNNSYLTIVTPSRWLYNKAKKGIFKNTDIRLIHNGVDEKIFKPYNKIEVRKELNLPVNKILLLFSAAWGLTAGTKDSGNTILKMYEHLKNNDDVVFIILGGAEKDFNDEKSIVIPYISDQILLAKYYSAADLFIYPSLWDNLPLAVIENMATGTPVLTYNTGGIPELVKHMGTGYIAKYNDTQDFMKGLDLFISDVNLRDSASERSIQIFLQDFTQTKMVNDYFSLYNELIQK
ncbi:glycosyltransferase, partial [Candidatus Dojkabacteria bacterium]|nr:glycosyltransferase [Candidatus Dojkabacteria bacterium]